jgi:hypothetical protein
MKLYVVQNREGKFFRSVGYNGGHTGGVKGNWVDTLDKAKFYAKIGQAKSRVTFFYKAWPSFGCPDILEFEIDVAMAKVLDMKAATDKKIAKARKVEAEKQSERAERHRQYLESEQARIASELKKLN